MRRKLVIAATVLGLTAFAGGAYAATQNSSTNARQNFLNDAAKRLHVSPAQLNNALNGAFDDQLNAAVKAGRLTQAQADAIKQRRERRGGALLPYSFHRVRPVPGARGVVGAAANYLGLTRGQLAAQLRSGKSLAQIAQAEGKSTDGLKQAIERAVRARLDKAVANKRITSGEEQQLLARINSRLDVLINRTPMKAPAGGRWGGAGGFGPGFGPPPPHPGTFVPPGP